MGSKKNRYLLMIGHLRIGIISGILHQDYGGPSSVIQAHIKGLSPYAKIEVFGVAKQDEYADIKNSIPNSYLFKRIHPYSWFCGKGLMKALIEAAPHLDIMHVHMLWDYTVYASWKASKKNKTPLFITPHGSVAEKWRYESLRKRIYKKIILDSILNDVTCIQVLTKKEEEACREFGMQCPIRIIPNGLPLDEFNRQRDPTIALELWPQLKDKKILLYLGRLWSGKGLDILPDVWAKVLSSTKQAHDWVLIIAGPDYRSYKSKLIKKIECLNIGKNVLLLDAVYAEKKDSLLSLASVFVMPSHGEGFSMSILEAASAALPILFTDKCNFSELASYGGGLEVADTEEDLFTGISEFIALPYDILKNKGAKAKKITMENFSLEIIAQKLLSMYQDYLN